LNVTVKDGVVDLWSRIGSGRNPIRIAAEAKADVRAVNDHLMVRYKTGAQTSCPNRGILVVAMARFHASVEVMA